MSGPDWIQTSDLQWLHQFREHFPVYSAPTPQMNKFRDIFRSILLQLLDLVRLLYLDILQVFTILYTHKLQRVVSIHRPPGHSPDALPLRHVAHMVSIVHCKV